MAQEDFCGHAGRPNPGGLQWITAGHGIPHAEIPCSEEPAHGLQRWVDLRSSEKMVSANTGYGHFPSGAKSGFSGTWRGVSKSNQIKIRPLRNQELNSLYGTPGPPLTRSKVLSRSLLHWFWN